MKALSIRQPWAWLILHGGKDIENRTWPTKLRGRFLIHASKGLTRREYEDVCRYAAERGAAVPAFDQLQRGGIIGSVELVDCVNASASPWYMGQVGFVLANPKPLPFMECKGALGFFNVPEHIARAAQQEGVGANA